VDGGELLWSGHQELRQPMSRGGGSGRMSGCVARVEMKVVNLGDGHGHEHGHGHVLVLGKDQNSGHRMDQLHSIGSV